MINHVQFPMLNLEFTVNRVAFYIKDFPVYWYGVLIAIGMLFGVSVAFRYCVDFGLNDDRVTDVVMISIFLGVCCARVYYVFFAPFEYQSLWEMIDIRDGGLAIYGGIIGGFLFGAVLCKIKHIPVLPLFDVISFAFLIGQGIGRWGNYANQEAFGVNTKLPWGMKSEATESYLLYVKQTLLDSGITIDPALPVHPTFLYESVWCLLSFVILFAYFKHRKFNGDVVLLYVIFYGAERFFVEGLRTDSLMIPGIGLRVSQMIALLSVIIALTLRVVLLHKYKGTPLVVNLPLEKKEYNNYIKFLSPETEVVLNANECHSVFVEKTKIMNEELEQLSEQSLKTEKDM